MPFLTGNEQDKVILSPSRVAICRQVSLGENSARDDGVPVADAEVDVI